MMAVLQRREIIVSGIRLTYLEREATPGSAKPPLLLLHGLVANADTFAPLLSDLPEDRRAVALDLMIASPVVIGTGFNVSFPGLARLTNEFCAAIGLQNPVLIGHSHGGVLSLQTAASFPGLPSGLILICPAHPFGGYDPRVVRFYLSTIGRIFAASLPHLPRWLQNYGIHRMTGPGKILAETQLAAYRGALQLPKTVPRVIRLITNWEADMAALRHSLEASPIDTPTLLLWGDKDPVVQVSTAPALEQHLTTWERFTLPGVGHLPTDEQPEQCASLIRTWLVSRDTH